MLSRIKQALRQTELHVFFFFLFLFLFLIPILRGDGPEQAEASYFHFYLIWGLCIAVLFVITRALKSPSADDWSRKHH